MTNPGAAISLDEARIDARNLEVPSVAASARRERSHAPMLSSSICETSPLMLFFQLNREDAKNAKRCVVVCDLADRSVSGRCAVLVAFG